jgi:ribosomal protein S12 methylthiotransferase
MERVDTDTAADRAEIIQAIQAEIMDEYSASMIGTTQQVLVDGFDQETEQFYGRTYADSPEIDSRVWIASEEALVEGSFVDVYIDGVVDGDLSGYIVEENA